MEVSISWTVVWTFYRQQLGQFILAVIVVGNWILEWIVRGALE